MKKLTCILAVALCVFSANSITAQENAPNVPDFTVKAINRTEWNTVVTQLKEEKWQDAEKSVLAYMEKAKSDYKKEDAAVLRYMLINAVAGQLATGFIDNAEALKKLKVIEGQQVITPTVTFKANGILNYMLLADDGMAWVKTTTNAGKDMIVLKETYKVAFLSMLQESARYDNRNFRMRAIVKSFTASNVAHPSLSVVYNDAEIYDISPAR